MFRRDDHDAGIDDEVSQFRRQADPLDEDEPTWDRDSTPPWERQSEPVHSDQLGYAFASSPEPAESKPSIVSADSTWTGTLASDGPIEIHGAVSGELVAAGNVFIAAGATVEARIQAVNLTVAGKLHGSVACTNRFEVLETGEVNGDILAPTIVVHDGAVVIGEFKMRDDEPDDADADTESDQS